MPDPKLESFDPTTANGTLADRAIRHAVFLERLKNAESNKVLDFINTEILPDLEDRVVTALNQIERRKKLATKLKFANEKFNVLDKIVNEQFSLVNREFQADLLETAKMEADFQVNVANSVLNPIGVDYELPSTTLLNQLATNSLTQGLTTKEHFKSLSTVLNNEIRKQIRIGIGQGESIPNIMRRIRGNDGVFGKTRRQTEAVVRTVVNNTVSQARETTYTQNSDLITGVQYLATLDSRTTLICASLDGQVFKVGEGPRPPQHFNCRSTTVPVLKSWKALGIDLKEAPIGTRESFQGVQVAADLTYPEWLRTQPVDVQNKVLGKTKATLFRQKKVDFSRFVDNRNNILTINEIRQLENI